LFNEQELILCLACQLGFAKSHLVLFSGTKNLAKSGMTAFSGFSFRLPFFGDLSIANQTELDYDPLRKV
jgi:hypothetical protein